MDEQNALAEAPIELGSVKPPRQFAQLGILVVDGSGSMTDPAKGGIQKAQATNGAVRELFTKFKASRVSRNFSFAVVTFDEKASVRLKPAPVDDNLDDNGDYNPLAGHGGGTNLYVALEQAEAIANDFLAKAPPEGVPHSAVVLVMSDGCCSDPARTKAVADRIKQGPNGKRVIICCAFFEGLSGQDQQGAALLRSIATDPVMGYKTVYDGAALREFFKASMSAASGGIEIK